MSVNMDEVVSLLEEEIGFLDWSTEEFDSYRFMCDISGYGAWLDIDELSKTEYFLNLRTFCIFEDIDIVEVAESVQITTNEELVSKVHELVEHLSEKMSKHTPVRYTEYHEYD